MSTRQAYPALLPQRDATCEGCNVPYYRVERGAGNARIVVRHRLKLVNVNGALARVCDKCRKTWRRFGKLVA